MGFSEKIEGFAATVKSSAQSTTARIVSIILRILTGVVFGYVLALIFQELLSFGSLMVLFFVVVFTAFFYRISTSWSILKILLFDLFCVLVLQVLKMYIMMAP